MRLLRASCLVLVLAIARDLRADPQHKARMSGVVTDESGAPIAGATVSAVGNLGMNDEITDSQGRFVLLFVPGVNDREMVRLRALKRGYVPYDENVGVSDLPWTPHLKKLVPSRKDQRDPADKPTTKNRAQHPNGPNEFAGVRDGATALFIPGPNSAAARSVGFNTSGMGRQEVSIQAQPSKLLFDPPGIVLKPADLPKELQIGDHKVTIVGFTSTGFTIDDHGIQGIVANAFVLEATSSTANSSQQQSSNIQTPSVETREAESSIRQLGGERIAEGWTLHKRGETTTLTIIINTIGFPSPLTTAINQGNVDIDSVLREKTTGLWKEISGKVPVPKPVETIYGKIKGQEFWLHVVHYIDRQPDTLEWNYEILVNGSGIAQTPNTTKIPLSEMSVSSRGTIADLDALATHTANRRYIDAVVRISE